MFHASPGENARLARQTGDQAGDQYWSGLAAGSATSIFGSYPLKNTAWEARTCSFSCQSTSAAPATVTDPTSRGCDLANPQRGGQPYQMCTHGGHVYAWRPWFLKSKPKRKIMSFPLARSAAGLTLLAALTAGCSTAVTAHSTAPKPTATAHSTAPKPTATAHSAAPKPAATPPSPPATTPPATTPAATPPATTPAAPSATMPAQPANPIPQGNGGDQDGDNNGGPSDGDGNI
jgi:hypothetical protein